MKTIFLVAVISLALLQAAPARSFCFNEAGAEYGVAPELLLSISKKESGSNQDAIHRNTNGSYDYCHMQINSTWYTTLGPERWAALADPCQCTKTGAWILKQCIQKYGYNWKAVGCYHSQTPAKRDQYARDISRIVQKMRAASPVIPQQAAQSQTGQGSLSSLVWSNGDATDVVAQ